jgi:uncharacterized protein
VIDVFRRFVSWVVCAPIRLYQSLISPALPPRCKYEPSCSSYALSALRSYGVFRGSALAVWRVLRCNPFSHGGYDPVEAQTLFRARPADAVVGVTQPGRCEHSHRDGAPA